jgi:hypothetical protein
MSDSESASRRPLEVKEGILLDRDGTPLLDRRGRGDDVRGNDPFGGAGPRVRVVRVGGAWLPLALLLLLPLLAAAGLTLFAVIAALTLAFAVLRRFLRALS